MSEVCDKCKYEQEINSLIADSKRNSEQHREFYNKIAENEKTLAISEERYTQLLQMMSEVKSSVDELKSKPGKRWDAVSTHVLTAVISLILGVLFSMVF